MTDENDDFDAKMTSGAENDAPDEQPDESDIEQTQLLVLGDGEEAS